MEDEDIYEQATQRIKAKKGFFYHFIAYACTLAMLYAILYFDNADDFLPVIIVGLSWGIGLAAHYFRTFGTENLDIFGINPNWEEEELEEELERLKRKRELKEKISQEKRLIEESDGLDLKDMDQNSLEDSEGLKLREIEKRPLDGNQPG